MNIQIETPRLLLRPFTLNDIEAAYNMNLDQEISIYTGDGGVVNYDEMERRIRGIISEDYMKYGYGRFAVELIGIDSFIGFAGLKYLPEYGVTDLGYRFKKKYWGQGIATEAGKASIEYGFKTLKLKELKAYAMEENKASIKVLTKLGFIYEMDLTEHALTYQQFKLVPKV